MTWMPVHHLTYSAPTKCTYEEHRKTRLFSILLPIKEFGFIFLENRETGKDQNTNDNNDVIIKSQKHDSQGIEYKVILHQFKPREQ